MVDEELEIMMGALSRETEQKTTGKNEQDKNWAKIKTGPQSL